MWWTLDDDNETDLAAEWSGRTHTNDAMHVLSPLFSNGYARRKGQGSGNEEARHGMSALRDTL